MKVPKEVLEVLVGIHSLLLKVSQNEISQAEEFRTHLSKLRKVIDSMEMDE